MKKYKINEIFYSIQGEGRWAGRAAVFVRFSGCNLKCPFCDTDFRSYKEYGELDILEAIQKASSSCRFVVFTGGEPTLQVDEALITLLHKLGYYLAMETNGTHRLPDGIDWVTCSPKTAFVKNGETILTAASEVKIVFDGEHQISDFSIDAGEYYVQPCDVQDEKRNVEILKATVDFVEKHPVWQLSLQQQKIINVR